MSNRLRIAIVGLRFGSYLIERMLTGDGKEFFEIAAVCDLDRQRADGMAGKLGVPAYYSLHDLLTMPDLPTIGLFTPPVGRAEQIRQIIRSGRDVMTTKPFELDPQTALDVLAEASSLGRVVHLNSPPPLPSPDLQQFEAWRTKYGLGRVISVRAEPWHGGGFGEEADGSWYDDPVRCPVAPIFRIGIYGINDLVWLLGEPEAVQVMHTRMVTRRPTPDTAQLTVRFKNGTIGTVFATIAVNDGENWDNRLTVQYERGTIKRLRGTGQGKGGGNQRTAILTLAALDAQNQPVHEQVEVNTVSGDYQWESFYRAVKGEKLDGQTRPEQIAAGIRIIQAMARAEQSGQTEPVV
ncbi:MAG: Gfo/Idh/MocA family oxidoreductase [Caldilineaceae bacterium]